MSNLKISTRLSLLIGMMSLLLLIVGGIGLVGISRANDAVQSVYLDRTVPTGQIAEIQRLLLRNRLAVAFLFTFIGTLFGSMFRLRDNGLVLRF
jgi:methyl-accepting chemotaxis protein-1 (serine sensor receptor)